MKRFYTKSIEVLMSEGKIEVFEDINSYVKLLEHQKSVLINELAKADTHNGNALLKRMGY